MAHSTLLLDAHLKALHLPTFLREYDKVARHCAQEGLDCPRYLFRLCELELLDREQRAIERRIKAAKFPVLKSLETFEFRAIPSLNKRLVLELTRSEYLDRRENVLALGNSGTGKTHCALALGLAACQQGYRVRFTTAAALVTELLEARDDKRLLRFQKQLAKQDLLIVDELGYVRRDPRIIARLGFPPAKALRTAETDTAGQAQCSPLMHPGVGPGVWAAEHVSWRDGPTGSGVAGRTSGPPPVRSPREWTGRRRPGMRSPRVCRGALPHLALVRSARACRSIWRRP